MAVVVASRVVGLGREMVVADRFGTSRDYDLFLLGSMFPVLISSVVDFAAFYLAVPLLTRSMRGKVESGIFDKSIWPTVNLTLGLAALIAVALVFLAPFLVRPYVQELPPELQGEVVYYLRILSLTVVFAAMASLFRAMLNAREVFAYAAGCQLVDNVVLIACVMLLAPTFGGMSLAVGVLLGSAIMVVYLGTRTLPWRPFSNWTARVDRETIQTAMNALGVLLVVEVINRSYFLIDRWFAIPQGEGIVAALNYSQVLVQVPDSIVGFAIASVAFPLFSATATSDPARFSRAYYRSIISGLMVAVPIAVVLFAGTADIVQILFLRGHFDETSLTKTVTVMQPWIPAVVTLFIVSTSLRACYAAGWAKRVLVVAILAIVVKVGGTFILVEAFGYAGISAATSLAQIVFALGLVTITLSKTARPIAGALGNGIVRVLIAGAVALLVNVLLGAMVTQMFTGHGLLAAACRLGITGVITLGIYLPVLSLIGPRADLKQFLSFGRGRNDDVEERSG